MRQGRRLCPLEEPRCCGLGPNQLAMPILQGWAEAADGPAAAILELRIVGNSQNTGAFLTPSAKVGPACAGSAGLNGGLFAMIPPYSVQNDPGYMTVPTAQKAEGARLSLKNRLKLPLPTEWPCRSSTTVPSLPSLLYFLQSIYQHLTHLFYLCC